MKKNLLWASLILFSLIAFMAFKKSSDKPARPNILLITSEDHSPHLSCYGDQVIKTPHLDQLASNGLLLENAYVTQSVCSPSRSSILTGLYPHQNGQLGLTTHGYHMVDGVKNIFTMLKQAGYRTGLIGKLHVDPATDFQIDSWPLKSPNYEKHALDQYAKLATKFMAADDQPFFLMVNYPDAHWPFEDVVEGRPKKPVLKDQIAVFPYIGFDNVQIRSYATSIYNGILRLDECIGELMETLKASGKQENTLIIYLSDHGDEMARGKFDIYEQATKVPFIVNWPGKVTKGIRSKALVSSVDIVPTILEAAGALSATKNLPGKSLSPLFKQGDAPFGDYLFTEKNGDQVDLYYPRRAVRDSRYKLIYSLLDDRKNIVAQKYTAEENRNGPLAGSPTIKELEKAAPNVRNAYLDWLASPKFQLYDLQNDPYEFRNLANDPAYVKIKDRLFKALQEWQVRTNDPLRFPEKLKRLTTETDSMKISKNMVWRYPSYLYGAK
jgi:N-sulfoglucosamine sulfohydrolase